MSHTFCVWAPDVQAPQVRVRGTDHAMRPAARPGWWEATVSDAAPGDDYAFVVDGEALPDPRSPWQPDGVGGPSRLVDHGAFGWTDAGWRGRPLAGSVVYELHIGTFSPAGTFDGVVERLDHLVDLGVDVVELLPVNGFSGRHGWGYDGVDLWAVHDAYGGPDGLKRLVDACHARGLAVALDVVYNHLGPSGNFLPRFGPYFTDTHHTPWGAAVNYDAAGSDEVRAFLVGNALMWLRDYHLDGLRLDAVHAIVDESAQHVLAEMAERVQELSAHLGRTLFLIAESDLNDPEVVRRPEVGGWGMDAQWSDDFHHALHVTLTGERDGYYADYSGLDDLATALTDGFVYAGRHSGTRGRRHGAPLDGVSGNRLLGYLQDHDQVGNRAQGERTAALVSPGRLKVGAAVVLTAPFTPMLWMGEEWGASTPWQYFTDHSDPELADAVRNGRRSEFAAFGWDPEQVPDPQDPATFERSRLRWEEVGDGHHAELLAWHRELIALRRSLPALTDGRLDRVQVAWDAAEGWLVMSRSDVHVAVNLGAAEATVPLPAAADVLAASTSGCEAQGDRVRLPADSVAVCRTTPPPAG